MDRASDGVPASPRFQRRSKTDIVKHWNRSEYSPTGNHDMAENLTITNQPLPHAQLIQMATAHWVSHIVYVAAKLNLADHLAQGPQRADTLARPTRPHAPLPLPTHADARESWHTDRGCITSLRVDACRGRTHDGRAGRGACYDPDAGE